MARYESSFSHTSSISLKEKNNYTQLLYAFEELYDQTNKLVVFNYRLRCLNNLLENKVNSRKIINDLEENFENLDLN